MNTYTNPDTIAATLPSSAVRACTIVNIHVDADRDGQVDDTPGPRTWTPGKNGSGAILCVNCDNDDGKSGAGEEKVDIADEKINGSGDLSDISPLDLRKLTNLPLDNCKIVLSVDTTPLEYREFIRIFNRRINGATEIIGPQTGAEKIFTESDFDGNGRIELGMEALAFPFKAIGRFRDSFDGYIKLHLRVEDTDGKTCHSEEVTVRVAPWILFNHMDVTEKVYVAKISTGQGVFDNDGYFIRKLQNIVGNKLAIIPFSETGNGDRWAQDIMEIGFSGMPTASGHPIPVVVPTPNRGRVVAKYSENNMLGTGFGWYPAYGRGTSLNSFGNLECSPPIPGYPYGRIIYGEPISQSSMGHLPMGDEMRALLEGGIQAPIHLDTGWLLVGHVDEFMSFIPDESGTHGFKIAFASPSLALQIVEQAYGHDEHSALFRGIKMNNGTEMSILPTGQVSLPEFLPYQQHSTVGMIVNDTDFKNIQSHVQNILNDQKNILMTELGLAESDFIYLPVLFTSQSAILTSNAIGTDHVAFAPGSVNMLVVTHSPSQLDLIIPKPFGPRVNGECLFESAIKNAFSANESVTPHFVDCFLTYHILNGEIHCGTNSKRIPTKSKWWEEYV